MAHLKLAAVALAVLTVALPPAAVAGFELINPLSVIANVIEAVVEDRSSEDIATDLRIKTALTAEVIDKMGSDVVSINFDVYEQDVMLTGTVETEEQKAQAGKLAAAIEGVKKVYNRILVIKDIDKEKGTVENFVDDTVIEKKINALLLDGEGVNVTNFRWRSVGGNVFLFGRALSASEHDKATVIVQDIANVVSVVNLAKIRSKE